MQQWNMHTVCRSVKWFLKLKRKNNYVSSASICFQPSGILLNPPAEKPHKTLKQDGRVYVLLQAG
jgi:hypothetical protein